MNQETRVQVQLLDTALKKNSQVSRILMDITKGEDFDKSILYRCIRLLADSNEKVLSVRDSLRVNTIIN